jgi:hypothetical protein
VGGVGSDTPQNPTTANVAVKPANRRISQSIMFPFSLVHDQS